VLESKTGHFDNANRLTELTDNLDATQTTTLLWDNNGNLLSETKAGLTTNYRYDLRDTLAEVERSGQPLARFLGDFDERRVLKIGDPTRPGGSGVQEYVYHGSRLVMEVENGQSTARYEWTNEELVSLLQSGGTRRYFALDGLETVLALTDEAGQATDRLDFDTWGVPKEGTDFGTSGNRFAFTSHRFDTELDLYYAGGRMYSPTIGRFISQDTLSLDPNNPDTWNLFSYGRANPTRYVDPTGHQTVNPDAPPDDVVGGEVSLARVKAEQARANAESADQPWNAAGSPKPVTVTEEDNGPLGNLIMRPLRALGRSTPVQKAGQGIRWAFDQIDVFAKKMSVVARVTTREQAGKQDEEALREKFDLYRAFEGQGGTPGDEIATRHIAVNTGREFVETAADINQRFTEETTRQGVPLVAGVIAKRGVKLAGEVAEELAEAPRSAAPASRARTRGILAGEAGRFGDLDARAITGDEFTPHHMPQAAARFTPRAEGGALVLPQQEHVLTRTYGAAGRAVVRQEAGQSFREVLARDIRDIRRIAGTKYDEGVRRLLEYYHQNFPGLMEKPPK